MAFPWKAMTSADGQFRQSACSPLATSQKILATGGKKHKGPQGPFDMTYFLKGALAGGICCSITHGALCPVDVVKTRIQLDPVKYNKGLFGGFGQVVGEEGMMALSTGFGPTAFGYFVQGWFKFGGVELVKINLVKSLGKETSWNNKTAIYLFAAACAEFVADIFLCPLEATRIKLVKQPDFAKSMPDAFTKIVAKEGFAVGFYSGFIPILFKQIPYTMAKFAVQGKAVDMMYAATGTTADQCSDGMNVVYSLGSGVIAGVASAIISQPADTLLSKVNVPGAGGDGPIMKRVAKLAVEIGYFDLQFTGLAPRCVMIGTLTALQFAIFDTVMNTLGARKFHFEDPADDAH